MIQWARVLGLVMLGSALVALAASCRSSECYSFSHRCEGNTLVKCNEGGDFSVNYETRVECAANQVCRAHSETGTNACYDTVSWCSGTPYTGWNGCFSHDTFIACDERQLSTELACISCESSCIGGLHMSCVTDEDCLSPMRCVPSDGSVRCVLTCDCPDGTTCPSCEASALGTRLNGAPLDQGECTQGICTY
jgi:hypothetical protein